MDDGEIRVVPVRANPNEAFRGQGKAKCYGGFMSLVEVFYRVWRDESKQAGQLTAGGGAGVFADEAYKKTLVICAIFSMGSTISPDAVHEWSYC